ncbi:MAG: UDP-N-acetylglucosamine--N-acetylmuramyl-(pentapeptide) pyrophosphoryl-undecaprenol [Solirubrobacteraceae bacterium]|nr:UDP-N-acetylglucosamine--N-acetylmuramyl-(pentapeptide) pyrophosphoryl-undecaprenol [Solirubrobacteraceae bacterium]
MVPALAVADELLAEGAEVTFIGGGRAEAQLVPAAGHPLYTLSVEGLDRSHPLRALRALALALAAVARARSLLRAISPDAVLGAGGYVAGPVGMAALTLRLPLVLTEADSRLGLTNRLLAPFARRVCLAFPIAGREGGRYRVTGRPVTAVARDRDAARTRLGIARDEPCVLVFGGSLGARSINLAALEGLADAPFHVLHVCGRRDYEELRVHERRAGYDLREYLDPGEFAQALTAADLAVARAGGSVFEIAAHRLPAILVPYPFAAGDHQSANASWMSDAGAALMVPDAELSAARLRAEVDALLTDGARRAAMAQAAGSLARPQAAREVARELLQSVRR